MKRNGFTLIELVGSIVIIAILAVLAFPAVISMLNEGQHKVDNSVKEVVKSAAADYVNDNINNHGTEVSVITLRDNGYISTSFYDKYCEIRNAKVSISKSGSKYVYEYNDDDSACNE